MFSDACAAHLHGLANVIDHRIDARQHIAGLDAVSFDFTCARRTIDQEGSWPELPNDGGEPYRFLGRRAGETMVNPAGI